MAVVRRFFLLSFPRTGSNLLVQVLNASSPDVTCYTELLHPFGRDMMATNPRYARPIVPHWKATGLDSRGYLEQVVWPSEAPGAVGLKLMLGQPETRAAFRTALDMGALPIYLSRDDRVRGVLSAALAKSIGKWWYIDQESWEVPERVTIQPKHVDHFARVHREEQDWVASVLPPQTIRVRYEELAEGAERILQRLGVDYELDLSSSAVPRRTPSTLWQRVTNLEEMTALAERRLRYGDSPWTRLRAAVSRRLALR